MRTFNCSWIKLSMGLSVGLIGCGGSPNAATDTDGGSVTQDGGVGADGGSVTQDGGKPTSDVGGPTRDGGDAGGDADAAVSDVDAGVRLSDACLAVLAELGEGVVGDAGLTTDYVGRATACGFRVAAFDRREATARWQSGWRFGPTPAGRYRVEAGRVIAAGDRVLVALYDTMPMSAEAAITIVADDRVFCQTVTYALRWPEVGNGAFATLPSTTATREPVADAAVAAVCRHGRVYRINVQAAAELTRSITPFGELLSGAGGSRLWSATALVDGGSTSRGFAVAIAARLLTAGTTPRFTLAAARTMIGTECRDVNLSVDFPYAVGAAAATASWTIGTRAQDPRLCTGRSTTVSVSDGYLLVN